MSGGRRIRGMYVVAFALLYAAAYLGWQATHGGVVSHHFLAQSTMPGISNWWGLAVFPLIGALTSWSVQRREAVDPQARTKAIVAAVIACVAGAGLGVAFSLDKSGNVPFYVFIAILACALFFRTYRPEYIFGFALGASVDFGLVLPAIISLIPAAISTVVFLVVLPLLRRLGHPSP